MLHGSHLEKYDSKMKGDIIRQCTICLVEDHLTYFCIATMYCYSQHEINVNQKA